MKEYSVGYKPQSQEELEKCQQFSCYEIKPIKLTKEQKKMFRLIEKFNKRAKTHLTAEDLKTTSK